MSDNNEDDLRGQIGVGTLGGIFGASAGAVGTVAATAAGVVMAPVVAAGIVAGAAVAGAVALLSFFKKG